jgi:uncharacterized protein YchJ
MNREKHNRVFLPARSSDPKSMLIRTKDGQLYADTTKGLRSLSSRNRKCPCGSGKRFKNCCDTGGK